ncbi:MAG: HAMP domain-containing protein [Anaerolineales bacterium]|nr:HAMP domain-containing protein [Anaerolineales bacterium]
MHRRVVWLRMQLRRGLRWFHDLVLGVPVRIKISGLVLLPVLILGLAVNFWVRGSLADWLTYVLDAERVGAAMRTGGRSVLMVTALATGISLLISWLLMLVLTEPILELRRVADQVRKGDLDQRAQVHSRDEIGKVGRSFNRMLDELVRSQRDLQRSNKRLGALVHVSTSVGRGLDLGKVLRAALKSTLEVTGLESGWIYLREPQEQRFYLACASHPPQIVTELPVTDSDQWCGCQQALLEDADWSKPQQRACRRLAPSGEGFGDLPPTHLSIPLRARGMNLGVFNLLWNKASPPDHEEMELMGAIGAQISEAVANARLHADLTAKEAGMEALVSSLVTAQEDERARISAELHDGAGQELTSVLLRLKALDSPDAPAPTRAKVEDLCGELSQAIENLRELSHQLRPPDLDQLGLVPTLRNLLTDTAGQAGLDVELESNLQQPRLDPHLEITLYRIAQEALTNVVRHADAGWAKLSLTEAGGEITLVVEDDGVGFDPDLLARSDRGHLGLASIQERAERMQGGIEVSTRPGVGTRLTVRVPELEVER